MTNLIQLGKVVLNSGKESDWKLVADQFIRDNLEGLAYLIRKMVGPYSAAEGIPQGGTLLAEAMRIMGTGKEYHPHLLVDDVLTTGGSMDRRRQVLVDDPQTLTGVGNGIIGAVVFARGQCPPWIKPLFQLPKELWL